MRSLKDKLLGKIEGLANDHGYEVIEVEDGASQSISGILWLQPKHGYKKHEQDVKGSGTPMEYFRTVLSIGFDFQPTHVFLAMTSGESVELDRTHETRINFTGEGSELLLIWLSNLNKKLAAIKERDDAEHDQS